MQIERQRSSDGTVLLGYIPLQLLERYRCPGFESQCENVSFHFAHGYKSLYTNFKYRIQIKPFRSDFVICLTIFLGLIHFT